MGKSIEKWFWKVFALVALVSGVWMFRYEIYPSSQGHGFRLNRFNGNIHSFVHNTGNVKKIELSS